MHAVHVRDTHTNNCVYIVSTCQKQSKGWLINLTFNAYFILYRLNSVPKALTLECSSQKCFIPNFGTFEWHRCSCFEALRCILLCQFLALWLPPHIGVPSTCCLEPA